MYLDPPYYGCEGYYGSGIFSCADFTDLRDRLAKVKGKFIMSINDVPQIRELFRDFTIMEVPTRYSVGNAKHNFVVVYTNIISANYRAN